LLAAGQHSAGSGTAAVVQVSGPFDTPTILMLLRRDLESKSSDLFLSLDMLAVSHLIVAFISAMSSERSESACSISPTVPLSLDMVAALSFASCVFTACTFELDIRQSILESILEFLFKNISKIFPQRGQ